MTDFTTHSMIPARRIRLSGLTLLQGIPSRMVALLALLGQASQNGVLSYGRALELTYLAPFTGPSHRPCHGLDEDLEGRDPNW
jgi:hypothetical protein